MRLLLKLLVLVVICLAVTGLWRGWFGFSSSPNAAADSNKATINVSVDKGKIKADVKKAKQLIKEEVSKLEGKTKGKEDKELK